MDPHYIELPRIILVGNRVAKRIVKVCEDLNIQGKVLVLTGPTTHKIAGRRIRERLESRFETSLDIVNLASRAEVERISRAHGGISAIVSVGGGKVIDVGKCIAFTRNIPFISIPTAPSHDGVASERVSLTDGSAKYSERARPPMAIIADLKLIRNAPYRLIASGCADVISNYSSVYDWKLARERGEYYSKYAAHLSKLAADIVIKSAELIRKRKERGIRNLIDAVISSGISMSMVQSSRPASGSEHLFSHALDVLGSRALHGEQCGVGTIITSYLQGQDWIMVRNTLKSIGAPTGASELGISKETAVKALVNARKVKDRYTILSEKPLDWKAAQDVCRRVGVV
ncbi:MAG: NAD(P)-dependent glycerol-1-phosphate dehydrogenase [Candidatus Aenigmarchaeota archaeon]|nr:NAD(P)-dependent glycerol-1-phosphate dehydrogenase [Candidatus Aenigmarchaeota archaeon]